MVSAFRRWVIRVLRAWLASLEGVPVPTGRVGDPDVALALAAAEWVGRLAEAQVTGTSKRQIVFRALKAKFPTAGTSDLNFAIEDAIREMKVSRVAREEVARG